MNPPLALSPVAVHRTVYLVPVQVSYWPLSYPSSSVHRGRPPAAGPPGGAAPSADVSAEIYVCVREPARRSNPRPVSQNLSKQNSIKCLWICYIYVMMFGNQGVWAGQKIQLARWEEKAIELLMNKNSQGVVSSLRLRGQSTRLTAIFL